MKKIANTQELEVFLGIHLKEKQGGYFVVQHKGEPELIWFTKHAQFNADGSDWYLEAPNYMRRFKINRKEDITSYEEMGYVIRDGYAYEVDTPQVSPFLPEKLLIEFLGFKEEDAVNWLLEHTYADKKWDN